MRTGPGIEGFEEVAALDGTALRALLQSARPEQRVWAIWELALRAGTAERMELFQRTAREPSAGVRRMLVVVLAGHHEVDLVVALGRHDPAIEVRAQAMLIATRLALGGAVVPAVIEEAYARDVPEVRAAVVTVVAAGAPDWLAGLAQRALRDPDRDVQIEGFEAALRLGTAASLERVRQFARDACGEVATRMWARWPMVMPAAEIVALLGELPELHETACAALQVPIGELAPLTTRGNPAIWRTLRARDDFSELPFEVAARAVIDGQAGRYLDLLVRHLRKLTEPSPAQRGVLDQLHRERRRVHERSTLEYRHQALYRCVITEVARLIGA